MPTYVYRCKNCHHEFERLQKMKDDALVTCPNCNQDTLVRIIHGGAGMVFKGSGFYLTDYKNSNTGSKGKSGTSGSASADAKPATSGGNSESDSPPKSDAKSEAKSESKADSSTGSSSGSSDTKAS